MVCFSPLTLYASLGFLKICSSFLGGLKMVWMLCLFKMSIRSVVPFTYGKMERLLLFNSSCDCVSKLFAPLLCLLIVLSTFFLLHPLHSAVRFVSNSWVLFVDVFSSEILNAPCISKCIATVFVLDDGATWHISICVLASCILHGPNIVSLLCDKNIQGKLTILLSMKNGILGCWLLRKFKNLWNSSLPYLQITKVSST